MRIRGMGSNVARLAVAAVVALWAGVAAAQEPGRAPVVVELYTSQGCSSCPPADELLRDLSRREGLIALALHVDYWDYIGWADIFARPEHTARQKAYAHAAGQRMIYTPQMVVAGRAHVPGGKAMAVMDAVAAARSRPAIVDLVLRRSGETLLVEARPLAPIAATLVVQLVRFMPEAEVDILRGENAGRRLSYTNIVTAWDAVAEWDGAAPLSLRLGTPGEDPAVVILQEAGQGEIVAAAMSR